MLIQKSIKLWVPWRRWKPLFESFVNSEEYQTTADIICMIGGFESFVNSEEYQTTLGDGTYTIEFESFVNSEEYQTS